MVYKPEWDTFTEGAGWGAWWIQNSYGFLICCNSFSPGTMVFNTAAILGSFLGQPGGRKAKGMWGGDTPT